MAGFPASADALKRVVAGLRSELAPILSLEMAAEHVWASPSRRATRKRVKVQIPCSSCVCVFVYEFSSGVNVF